ncbi:MAG: hypothetical protein V3T72_08070 [Thermoanaerobaculia bacterium]
MVGNLSQRLEQLRNDMTSALETAGQDAVSSVLEAIAAIDRGRTQREILLALVEGASRFASRAAFFLTRQDKIRGWAAFGFGRSGPALEGLEIGYEDEPWSQLAEGGGAVKVSADGCAALSAQIDAPAGEEGILIPFVLRGQLAGALYADRLQGQGALGLPSLLLLTHTAAQELETAGLRQEMSPALRISSKSDPGTAGIPLWQQEAQQEAVAETPVAEAPAVEEPVEQAPAEEASAEEAPTFEESPPAEAPWKKQAAVEAEPEAATRWAGETAPSLEAPAPAEESPVAPEIESADAEANVEPDKEEFEEAPEPELEDTSADIWALEEDEEPTEAGLEAPVPPPLVGQETVRLDVAALQGQQAPPAPMSPQPVIDQGFEPPDEPPSGEPPSGEPAVLSPEVEVPDYELEPVPTPEPEAPPAVDDDTEMPTIISKVPLVDPRPTVRVGHQQRPQPQEEAPGFVPPPAEPAPAPEPEAEPPPSSTTQVEPPAGLQGPGLAFTQSSEVVDPSQEEALHEEARRLARLLVSEIKLYNEEIIEEGRRNGDIYERLKDDIDRSRQMYAERIDPRLHGKEDYFRQELVKRLAGGDENLLGM